MGAGGVHLRVVRRLGRMCVRAWQVIVRRRRAGTGCGFNLQVFNKFQTNKPRIYTTSTLSDALWVSDAL